MKTKRFIFTALIITVFAVMFMTACNMVLHEQEPKKEKQVEAVSKPGTPSTVTATAASSSSITLSWTAAPGATGYKVYRSSTSSSSGYTDLGSKTPPFTDTGLSAGTAYYYKVIAYNSAGDGPESSAVSETTAPDAPTGVTAAASVSSITLSWTAVPGATGYRVYRNTIDSHSETEMIDTPASTSYTDTSLAAGTPYFYRVTAYNNAGESPKSSPAIIIGIGNKSLLGQ